MSCDVASCKALFDNMHDCSSKARAFVPIKFHPSLTLDSTTLDGKHRSVHHYLCLQGGKHSSLLLNKHATVKQGSLKWISTVKQFVVSFLMKNNDVNVGK
jgi:hypothetical protein